MGLPPKGGNETKRGTAFRTMKPKTTTLKQKTNNHVSSWTKIEMTPGAGLKPSIRMTDQGLKKTVRIGFILLLRRQLD